MYMGSLFVLLEGHWVVCGVILEVLAAYGVTLGTLFVG